MLAATFIGEPVVVLGLAGAVIGYGAYQSNAEIIAIGLMVPLTLIIGTLLKVVVERTRPLTEYAAGMRLKTFSFPSGHASGSVAVYGGLAVIADSVTHHGSIGAIVATATAIIVLIGLSRVYLGAHFPSDVVAGWLLGACSIVFMVTVIRVVV